MKEKNGNGCLTQRRNGAKNGDRHGKIIYSLPLLLAFILSACTPPEKPRPQATPTTTMRIIIASTTTTTLPRLPLVPHFDQAPMVRVWLSDLPEEPTVQVKGSCKVATREGQSSPLAGLASSRVSLISGGFRIGGQNYVTRALDIVPDSDGALLIQGKPYSGTLRIIRGSDCVALINLVDLENYLKGVLGSEMPPTWHSEALKAQAVAARTYALSMCKERAASEWDMTSTVEDQVYDGGKPKDAVIAAVDATAGVAVLHNNVLFPAFFHSTCGGNTEAPGLALGKPEYDFLEGVDCPWCENSPHRRWRVRVLRWDLAKRLIDGGVAVRPPISTIETVQDELAVERKVKLIYDGGDCVIPLTEFRKHAGRMAVKSGRFECHADDTAFVFIGRGLGHGAGMCQYGAKGMAEAGKTWREIVANYYRNTDVEKIY